MTSNNSSWKCKQQAIVSGRNRKSRGRTKLAIAAVLSLMYVPASADDYPDRPVRLIVPYATGGATDTFARLVGNELSKALGKPFLVENRAGGATVIGTVSVATAKPDGYTILVAASSMANLFLVTTEKLPFEMSDFVPIGSIANTPLAFAISPSLPVQNVEEFATYAKANSAKVKCGTWGPGTMPHFACELINQKLGLQIKAVPYRGSGPALTDLMGGDIQLLTDAIPTAMPSHEGGQARILGVMSDERVALAKSIPTLKELGYPELIVTTTFGLLAPAKTPPAIVEKLSSELSRIVRQPDIAAKIEMIGGVPAANNSNEFDALIKREGLRWAAIAKELNLTSEPGK